MSLRARKPADNKDTQVQALRDELTALKQQQLATDAAGQAEAANAPELAFEGLNETEKSAASLGVHPDAWKPIKFMNNAHYDTLIKSNALEPNLARRIEAFRTVAEASEAAA
jgi:hypothetical protein